MTLLDRTWFDALVNDDGSNTLGTNWNKARIAELLDSVDALLTGILSITGPLTVTQHAIFGDQYYTSRSPAAFAADTHNWAAGVNTILNVSATVPVNLTGMVPAVASACQLRVLANYGAPTITIKHEHASSSAANRFYTSAGTDIVLPTNATRVFLYHAVISRWRPWIDG